MKYDHQWATADDCDWSFDKLRGRHYHSQSKEVFRWENLYLGELNTRMTNWFRIVFTLFTRFPSSCRRHLGLTKSATRPSPRGGRFNTETGGCSSFTWHCRAISHQNEILAPVQQLSWSRTRMTHSDMKVQTKTTNIEETKTRRNVWSYRFFHLYLVYFNSTKLVLELGVEEENIAIINIPALERDKQHGVVGLSPTIGGYEKWFPLN